MRIKIFAYGFRNVYGLAVLSDARLIGIDHGPLGGDELNVIRKSANYGWPKASEGVHYTGEFIPRALLKVTRPILYWADAVAPSAITLVSKDFPTNMNGDLMVSTLKGKSIFRIHEYCGSTFKIVEHIPFDFRIRDFLISLDGQLITLSDGSPSRLSIWPISY